MTHFELVQIRVTLSALILAAAFGIFARKLLRIRAKDLGYFLLLGSIAMAMVQGTYLYAISKIQVAAAIFLQYLSPILVAFFSICFWNERLTVSKLAALTLALSGCYLVVGGYDLQLLQMNRLGIMGGLGSAVCAAGYTLLGERGMHRYGPLTILFYAMAFAALTWHILYPPFYYITAGFSLNQWGWILYITVLETIFPFGLYFMGIDHIPLHPCHNHSNPGAHLCGLHVLLFLRRSLGAFADHGSGFGDRCHCLSATRARTR